MPGMYFARPYNVFLMLEIVCHTTIISIIRDVVLGSRTRTRSRGTCILRYLIYRVCLVDSLPVAFYFLASSR